MQKAVVYTNSPDDGDKIEEQIIIKLIPLYKTAKLHKLKIVNHYFDRKDSCNAFLKLVDDLKKDISIKNVIMDNNEIIMNEKVFMELLELERTVYIVGDKTTNVISPDEIK